MNRVYMDNAATTTVSPAVLEKMLPYFSECYGNANSIHSTGLDARKALNAARKKVAAALNCNPEEVYFTSGGSESDNWALKGVAFANRKKGNHIITSAIEHHANRRTLFQPRQAAVQNGIIRKRGFNTAHQTGVKTHPVKIQSASVKSLLERDESHRRAPVFIGNEMIVTVADQTSGTVVPEFQRVVPGRKLFGRVIDESRQRSAVHHRERRPAV